MSNLQLNKLKSGIKNGTQVTINLLTNAVGDSDDETNFLRKLLLTDRQISRMCKTFENRSSANTKLLKTQLQEIEQLGGFLGKIWGSLLKSGLSLMKNLFKPLAKSFWG